MRRLWGLGFVLCFFVSICFAQSQLGTGAISGTVIDPSGQAVADAAVTVTSTDTGLVRNVTTGMAGQFLVPVLPTGTYAVRVEKAGFSTLEQKNLVVNVGSTTTLHLQLKIGAVQAVVEVTAEAPMVDTTRTEEVSLVDRQQIADLPINGRRADQFALLVPGVVRDGTYGQLSYAGVSGVFNNYTVEGNDDNQAYNAEPRGRTRIASNISANSVQEFQVGKSNFLPEFGRAAGGSINAVVRSGGNRFHTDAFYYFRNQDLGARDPFATFRPDEQRQQFGGSVSGPIRKDKLFYFVNYDQQLRNFPELIVDTYGTLTQGRPTAPSSPTYQQDLAAFNAGVDFLRKQYPGGGPGGTLPRRFDQNNALAKVDWLVSQRNTFSATYNYLRSHAPNGMYTSLTTNGPSGANDDVRINTLNARFTSALSARKINEMRFQYSRDFGFAISDVPGPGLIVNSSYFGRNSYVDRFGFPDERRVQVVDNFSYIKGTHAFKFGGDINRPQDSIDQTGYFQGSYSYSNAMLLGRDLLNPASAGNYSSFTQYFGLRGITFATVDYAAFAQDQWKVRRNLTLNYGVRYDYQQFPKPVFPNPAIPETTRFNADRTNFGPRAGAAYDLRGNGKTVIRGGYAILYGRTPNGSLDDALRRTGLKDPTRNTLIISGMRPNDPGAPRYPTILPDIPATAQTSFQSISRLDPDFRRPRVQQMNAGIERRIIGNLIVSASYLRTKGDRLPMSFDTNLIPPNFTRTYQFPDGSTFTVPYSAGVIRTAAGVSQNINLSRPNPNYASISVTRPLNESWYNAMLIEVKRRFAQGFQLNISYTLAKAENLSGSGSYGGGAETAWGGGSVANQYNLKSNRGIAPNAQHHRLVANGVWNLPFSSGNPALNRLVHGYRLSGIFSAESGRPFSASIYTTNAPFTGPDGAQYQGLGSSIYGQSGLSLVPTIPRNSNTGYANYRLDLRFARDLHVTERMTLELLCEGFNVFNHSNFNQYNTAMYDFSGTSAATSLTAPIKLNARSNFGTPSGDSVPPDGTGARRLQLSVRFRF